MWTVEGPRLRKPLCDMSSWARIVDEDGSTVAYVPSMAMAIQIAGCNNWRLRKPFS